MSEIVRLEEANPDIEGKRKVYEKGDDIEAPSSVTERFDTQKIVRGTIKEFEDEGHRISAKCIAEFDGQSEKYYVHFTVGNHSKIFYDPKEGDEE